MRDSGITPAGHRWLADIYDYAKVDVTPFGSSNPVTMAIPTAVCMTMPAFFDQPPTVQHSVQPTPPWQNPHMIDERQWHDRGPTPLDDLEEIER